MRHARPGRQMKAYLDFEIQISALDAGRYMLSVSGPGGDARHMITLPLGDPTYEELPLAWGVSIPTKRG